MLTELKNIRENYIEWSINLLLLLAFFFPQKIALAVVVSAVCVIVAYTRKQLVFKLNPVAILFFSLYLAYLVGVLFTQDREQAFKYLEYKLAFLLFPLLFSFAKKGGFKMNMIYLFMIGLSLFSFVRNIVLAFKCFDHYESFPYCFIKGHLSSEVHPTYLSFLLCIAILGLYSLWKNKQVSTYFFAAVFTVLSVYTILLMSLSGVIFFLLLLLAYSITWLYKRMSLPLFTGLSVLILLLGVLFFTRTPFLKDDVNTAFRFVNNYLENPAKFVENMPAEPSGTETRLIMWTVASQEILKHPFGVGTGNVDIYLTKNLVRKGKQEFAKKEYNPHNQFLQTTLEIGIFGLLILLLILFFGIRIAVKNKHWLLLILTLNMLFNCLFESMLQSQIGVVFYPLFLLLFIVEIRSEKLIKTKP